MKRLLSIFLILFMVFGLMLNDANAKRFGGGRSFGMQRTSSSTFSRAQNINSPQLTPQKNRWLGPLAGFAAGGLLSYLLMGHGVGSGMFSWIIMGVLIFMLLNFLRNRMQFATQTNRGTTYENTSQEVPRNLNAFNNVHSQSTTPLFDENAFLREAKVQFIRLQAAYDNKNLNDIREFSTPEVFAEIQLQLQERGDEVNYTEVTSVNAELLNTENETDFMTASVRFSGMIKEELNGIAKAFNETWHFKRNHPQSVWLVSGIQQ
jgi:predicted lipid-binding transport protein (Tim44 family)